MITAHSPSTEALPDLPSDLAPDAPPQATTPPAPAHAAPRQQSVPRASAAQQYAPAQSDAPLAPAIDQQAQRVDQLSAAILRATAQLSWSGRAADRFRDRASERARECLQLAVALRASGDRIHAATAAGAAVRTGAGVGAGVGAGTGHAAETSR